MNNTGNPAVINITVPSGIPSRLLAVSSLALLMLSLEGCTVVQAVSGIPAITANRLPPDLSPPPRSAMQEISMSRLRQDPPDVYQLDSGDILGIYIENVIGNSEEPPPVHFPEDGSQPPAIGFPIPVREDGTIALPLVPAIKVSGLTLGQTTNAVRDAYTVDQEILPKGKDRIIVTLMRRRTYRVLVVREESGGELGVTKRGTGYIVDLPAYENDLLHALNETGGLPGVDAQNEVLIVRGSFRDGVERDKLIAQMLSCREQCFLPPHPPQDPNVVRVPIRFFPNEFPTFDEKDIVLATGDIVMIQARDIDKFYTGGLLGGGEFLLPRDYDLDVLSAIAVAGGPVGGGGSGISSIGGRRGGGNNGINGGIPPSRVIVMRKIPGGGQIPIRVDANRAIVDPSQRILIQAEDVILLQYTFEEELINALLNLVQFNFLFNGFNGGGF